MATDLSRQQTSKAISDYPPPPPVPEPRLAWASPEERAAFVRRVRDVLSGKVPPEPMVTPPVVQAMVEMVKREHPRTIAKTLRYFADQWNLQYYFGGRHILCLETPHGLMVIANGGAEIRAVYDDCKDLDQSKVYSTAPTPWGMLNL